MIIGIIGAGPIGANISKKLVLLFQYIILQNI